MSVIVRSESLPHDRRVGVPEQRLQNFFADAFAVGCVGHDDDADLGVVEADGVIAPAVVVVFSEELIAASTSFAEMVPPSSRLTNGGLGNGLGSCAVAPNVSIIIKNKIPRKLFFIRRFGE